MMNPIKEMRRLSNSSFEELKRFAAVTCGLLPDTDCSKVELITYIVVHECMRDHMAETNTRPEKNSNRTRYRFRGMDETEHYVMLTPEQERFMRWNHDNGIDYDNIDIDIIEDIDWEAP